MSYAFPVLASMSRSVTRSHFRFQHQISEPGNPRHQEYRLAEAFSVLGAAVDQLLRIMLLFFLQLSQESIVPQGTGRMLAALLEALCQNLQARKPLLGVHKNSGQIFGLNVVAEAEFNAVFDDWRRKHSQDIL